MKFDLGDVLSITTEKLLSREHVGGVYKILNHMTGDTLFTHQLPRAGDVCKPFILRQHPELPDDIKLPPLTPGKEQDEVNSFVDSLREKYGSEIEIDKLPEGAWESKNPITELCEMAASKAIAKATSK